MADSGPLLTSCIIFYLSIGAAIFQILEEPNWKSARDKYILQKENILRKHECLTKESLDDILEMVSEAAGQGVTITGEIYLNTWDWGSSVIFASTIVTTIGFGNVAPKTKGGRVFCILYGLCGIPLCLVWISKLGSFFGDRAKRLSQVLIRKGVSVKRVQLTCTALFLLWGLLLHLVIPPFVFMSVEDWSYLEGLYYSFITLTTVGFGDYVAGVDPNIDYPRLYRIFAELWIYMGLAWLSLFFSWNVHMVVEAHKVFRKRRHKHRHIYDQEPESEEDTGSANQEPSYSDIFNVIKEIGTSASKTKTPPLENLNRSKSCSDITATYIRPLEQSPKHRRKLSISEMFVNVKAAVKKDKQEERSSTIQESNEGPEPAPSVRMDNENSNQDDSVFHMENAGIIFKIDPPAQEDPEEDSVQDTVGSGTRFTISKVSEKHLLTETDEKG